ncbi:YlxR family protein [Nocardioides donggukensis]|uniref:YlxR family protein n=1 Tax=Nocardioides donggukensis TaxID=2774019 RepID=A0A927K265_9ACTN|nr:YlxR family protein [Nocardioides donggukensis]MBD8869082.1 YlxR family protein [Nocardioides donggukensis]
MCRLGGDPVESSPVAREHTPSACPDTPAPAGPVRTCIGCRERATKRELLRVVAGSDAHGPAVVPDPSGTAPGRGAHLHPTTACYDLAVKRRAFGRALRLAQGLPSTPVGNYLDSHHRP